MQRRTILPITAALLALPALLAAGPQAARAQGVGVPAIRVKLGVFLPNDSDTKSFAGSTHYGGEVDLATPVTSGGQGFLSLGYTQGRRGGRSYQVIPLGLSKVNYFGNPVAGLTGNIYFGGGVGAYFLHASGGGTSSQSKTRFGAFLQAGYVTPLSGIFIEGKYHFVNGDLNGLGASGLSVFIGKKL